MAENTVNIFERALRARLRFETTRGLLSVEDIWHMPLTSNDGFDLDSLARELHRQVKDSEEVSFVVKTTASNAKLELAFDVVKHVIDVKLAERDEAKTRAANREKKQELLAILADKDKEELRGKSREEIAALVEAL
jgi:transcriptional antiterminator Rof (Rho-off)